MALIVGFSVSIRSMVYSSSSCVESFRLFIKLARATASRSCRPWVSTGSPPRAKIGRSALALDNPVRNDLRLACNIELGFISNGFGLLRTARCSLY